MVIIKMINNENLFLDLPWRENKIKNMRLKKAVS